MKRTKDKNRKGRIKEAAARFGRRTFIFAVISFFITLAFALFNAAMTIFTRSVWHASLAGYYFLLSVLRIAIVFNGISSKRKFEGRALERRQLLIYSSCGAAIIILELALTAAVVQLIYAPPALYKGVMAIASAAYTFYKTIMAIKNLVRAKEYNDYAVQSLRNLSLVEAVVSLLTLSATLIGAFGNAADMQLLIIGIAVALGTFIVGIGVYMIIRSAILLKRLKQS